MQKTALLAGATGLIGSQLLPLLLASERYAKVIVVGRKAVPTIHPKLVQVVTELDKLEEVRLKLIADDVFCCLGTTMAQAGSKEAFFKVDFLYVVQLAALAAGNFAAQFMVVSSMGADAESRIYYSRVKGEMEAAVARLDYECTVVAQPSLLLGSRSALGQAARPREARMQRLPSPVRFLIPKSVRPIHAGDVAAAMLEATLAGHAGLRYLRSARMQPR